jgi:DNA-binding LacI/PurR family transcriptional regulator
MENRPTCIIFPDDYSLIGTVSRLSEEKYSLLDNVSVMGYDGIKMAQFMGLTTYQQDALSLGRIACKRLIDAIEDTTGICEHSVVAGRLIEGGTVKQI